MGLHSLADRLQFAHTRYTQVSPHLWPAVVGVTGEPAFCRWLLIVVVPFALYALLFEQNLDRGPRESDNALVAEYGVEMLFEICLCPRV